MSFDTRGPSTRPSDSTRPASGCVTCSRSGRACPGSTGIASPSTLSTPSVTNATSPYTGQVGTQRHQTAGLRCSIAAERSRDDTATGHTAEIRALAARPDAATRAAAGRAAHSAYPAEGESALLPLLDAIERIRALPLPTDPLLGPSTLNIGLVRGGVAPNVIPPDASAQLLFRTVGPTDALKAAILEAAGTRVGVRFAVEIPAFKGSAPEGWESTVVSFASDLPFLLPWGRCFQMGPGSIRVAHTAGERIGKREFLDGIERYVALAADLLATEAR